MKSNGRNRRWKKSKIEEVGELKKSKIKEVRKLKRLKFGDST
jgi:hypothetical protein